MKFPAVLALFGAVAIACAQSKTLADFEAKKPADASDMKKGIVFTREVAAFINKNELTTADEFYRASKLMNLGFFDFRTNRVRYELLLTAASKGSEDAEKELWSVWDTTMLTLGQPMRIDRGDMAAKNPGSDFFRLERAPDVIMAVFSEPAKCRAIAATSKDNAEMQEIVDADQKVRENFTKMTSDQIKEMVASDHARLVRTQEIVRSLALHTANDFANAALVMQHSVLFSGYRLAHELAVCSMLLGDKKTGRWLVAASYDRMLSSLGHDQRFGTQYDPGGFKITDELGICDAERTSLGCPTLEQARTRVFN